MISIVIPLYNKEKQISNTLYSVIQQTFHEFEIVIVDDGSTDNSVNIIQSIHDHRIRIIQQQNKGVSAARNRGIKEAQYDLIAFLDADDEWKPTYLETQYKLYKKYPECSIFTCNYEFKDDNERIYPTIIRKLPFNSEDGIIYNYFEIASYSHPPITSISIMVKKNAIQSIGGFPLGIKSGEDLLTWARLACHYSIAYTKKPQAIYNLGEGYNKRNLPPRRQDKGDPVGKGLIEIYKKYPKTPGIRTYISHWHKMRASVAIRYGEKKETIKEILKGLYYNPINYKLILLLPLVIIPSKIRKIIISKYH